MENSASNPIVKKRKLIINIKLYANFNIAYCIKSVQTHYGTASTVAFGRPIDLWHHASIVFVLGILAMVP